MRYFIRVDDLGQVPQAFARLLQICENSQIRLNAAAIPHACREIYSNHKFSSSMLEIHAHGGSHANHNSLGKKSEYPEMRGREEARKELREGFETLSALFPEHFAPIFVPPWNRIAETHLHSLSAVGFKAISRFGAKSAATPLLELNAHFDLHTSGRPEDFSIPSLLEQMEKQMESDGLCGLMLHHNHMREEHFTEWETLTQELNKRRWTSTFLSEYLT